LTQAINELQADLQPRIPNEEEIETIERYAQQIRERADLASNDPAEQGKIYQTLQMQTPLNYEQKGKARRVSIGQNSAAS